MTIDEALSIAEKLDIEFEKGFPVYRGRKINEAKLILIAKETLGTAFLASVNCKELFNCICEAAITDDAQRIAELREQEYAGIRDFIDTKMAELQVEIKDNGVWTYIEPGTTYRTEYTLPGFINYCHVERTKYNMTIEKPLRPLPDATAAYLDVMLQKSDAMRRAAAMEKVQYVAPVPGGEADEFIKELLPCYFIQTSQANIAMFKHLIWSIKRNLFSLPVDWPIFYSFHSFQQGTGKTQLVKRLMPFIWGYSGNGTLEKLTNINDTLALLRGKLLIDFQELAATGILSSKSRETAESAVSTIKALITSNTLQGRVMYTTTAGYEANRAVFATSTNAHIWEVLPDHTGMRRFWEFQLHVPKREILRETDLLEFYKRANPLLDSIEYLYRVIDENNAAGFYGPGLPAWEEIRATQDGYSKSNILLQFVLAMGLEMVCEPEPGAVVVPVKKFVGSFNNYLSRERPEEKKWTAARVEAVLAASFENAISVNVAEPGNAPAFVYYIKGWKI